MSDSDPVILPRGLLPPDYNHWARLARWVDYEVVGLALGFCPDPRILASQRPAIAASKADKIFAQRLENMTRLVHRHFADARIRAMAPEICLEWMRDQRLWIPEGMAEAISEFHRPFIDWKSRAATAEENAASATKRIAELEAVIAEGVTNVSSSTRERDSLLKLFIGVAVEQYGFDPKASRSKVATQIASDVERAGLLVSDDTIRKYLREGAELLPPPETE